MKWLNIENDKEIRNIGKYAKEASTLVYFSIYVTVIVPVVDRYKRLQHVLEDK
jgi:hypothetical protein